MTNSQKSAPWATILLSPRTKTTTKNDDFLRNSIISTFKAILGYAVPQFMKVAMKFSGHETVLYSSLEIWPSCLIWSNGQCNCREKKKHLWLKRSLEKPRKCSNTCLGTTIQKNVWSSYSIFHKDEEQLRAWKTERTNKMCKKKIEALASSQKCQKIMEFIWNFYICRNYCLRNSTVDFPFQIIHDTSLSRLKVLTLKVLQRRGIGFQQTKYCFLELKMNMARPCHHLWRH